MDDAVWNHAVFSKNRERLLTSEVAQQFFAAVTVQAKRFMSDEHFTVDDTLIQAWASHKSFRKKDGSDDAGTNFHDDKRSNETHESTTDPDARLYKKSYGKESYLAYLGHALVENRNGLIAAAMVTQADGYAEREAALPMLADKQQGRSRRIAVGADKAYDDQQFVEAVRKLNVTPHVSRNDNGRRSNMDRQDDPARRLRDQPELPLAGGEELRVAEGDRARTAGEGARAAQGRLGLRLQRRGPQLAQAAKADRTATRIRCQQTSA
jgi:hypothetical protein